MYFVKFYLTTELENLICLKVMKKTKPRIRKTRLRRLKKEREKKVKRKRRKDLPKRN